MNFKKGSIEINGILKMMQEKEKLDLKITRGYINGNARLDIVCPITKIVKTWMVFLLEGRWRGEKERDFSDEFMCFF